MQLTVQQPDLAQMFGPDSLYSTLYGLQRNDQANANNAQNLGQAQQEQNFQAQLQPYAVEQAAANIPHTQALTSQIQAQTPGFAADSTMKQNAASADSSIPSDVRNKAALAKTAAGMSQDQYTALEMRVYQGMASPDPKVRAQAAPVFAQLPALRAKIMELQQQGTNSARVAGIEQAGANSRETQEINAGKYAKNSVDYLMIKGMQGNFQQQSGAWAMKAAQAEDQGDHASAERYRQMSDLARASDKDARAAAAYTALAKSPDFASLGISPAVSPSAVAPQVPGLNSGVPGMMQPGQLPDTSIGVKAPPKPGSVIIHSGKSYKFKGGDPSNQSNWEQQ